MNRDDVLRSMQNGGDMQGMLYFLQKYIMYRKKILWTPKRIDPMQIYEAHQYAIEWSMREFNICILRNKQGQAVKIF